MKTFTVRSTAQDDPERIQLLAARDKLMAQAGVKILHQLPNDASPTRFLVEGDELALRELLREFQPVVQIELNEPIHPQMALLKEKSAMAAKKIGPANASGDDGAAGLAPAQDKGSDAQGSPADASPAGAYKEVKIEVLQSAPKEFIISPKLDKRQVGLQMLNNAAGLINDLKSYAGLDVEIIQTRELKSQIGVGPAAASLSITSALLVKMDEEKGKLFAAQSLEASSPLWVEENRRIDMFEDTLSRLLATPTLHVFSDGGQATRIDLLILGEGDRPLPHAIAKIYTSVQMEPLTAQTNEDGVAAFQLPGALLGAVTGIVIDPHVMHWSKVIRNPQLKAGTLNSIRVSSFAEFDARFTLRGSLSWGLERLGLHANDAYQGSGIKIGVIDSGCDSSHPLLQHVTKGTDFNPGASAGSWQVDEIGHGTHVCGIIGARGLVGGAVSRGVAPGAEMSMYKVFPKGDFFMLGGAIEAAIADGVDILNMSLGSTTLSPDIVQQISMARDAGIACFVAAGNSGNGVQFPAMLSSVMAVGALGHTAAMPADSMSANTLAANFAAPDGFFSPSFTCFGPSIDFAAPGVGVISTYPGNGLKALDGTSMATPHLAGLAALYLEHDPGLRSAARNAARTDLLFDMLRQRSSRLPFAADRVGNGMPMLVKPLQPFVHPNYGQPHTFMSAVMAARPGAWMNGDGSAGARHAGCDHP